MTRPILVIPAAGRGSRLGSSTPKLLVPVNGTPMIDCLRDLYVSYVSRIVLVVHPSSVRQVRTHVGSWSLPVTIVVQETPSGMLDALLLATHAVQPDDARQVWITWCDQVGVHPGTVERLTSAAVAAGTPDAALVMPTVVRKSPYIHLERDAEGRIIQVLHRREGDDMPEEGESDMGLFALSRHAFTDLLPRFANEVGPGRVTGERNFLPFVAWLARSQPVVTFAAMDEAEAVGVNTPEELLAVERIWHGVPPPAALPVRTLSIVIPAFNEARFIATLLQQIREVDLGPLGFDKEIIVVDDCSRDGTSEQVSRFPEVTLHRQAVNGGKGRAVRKGIELATGELLIIQDADLECDPRDYKPMLQAWLDGRGDVVYGSRYLGRGRHANQSVAAYVGGRSLSLAALLATGRYLTDTVTAYKLFRRADLASLDLRTSGFELDHEITARVIARGLTIAEIPIRYAPRSRQDGKKIGMRDWFIALRTFYRFRNG